METAGHMVTTEVLDARLTMQDSAAGPFPHLPGDARSGEKKDRVIDPS